MNFIVVSFLFSHAKKHLMYVGNKKNPIGVGQGSFRVGDK